MRWRAFWILLAFFVLVRLGYAGEGITVDLGGTPVGLRINAANKTLLTRLLTRENVRRAAQTPALDVLTLEQYVRDLIIDMVRGYAIQTAREDSIDACAAFKILAETDQQVIVMQLGGKSPCP